MNALDYHWQELQLRVNRFDDECDRAVNSIKTLRFHARTFVETMPCDRTELKNRYLWCTRQLDEFKYLVTEFNLSVGKFAEENDWPNTSDTPEDTILPPKNEQSETNISKSQYIKIIDAQKIQVPIDAQKIQVPIDAQKIQVPIDAQKVQVPQHHHAASSGHAAKPLAKETEIKHVSTEYPSQSKTLPSVHLTEPPNWRDRSQIIQETKQNWRETQNIQTNQTGRASKRTGPQTSKGEKLKEDLIQFSSVSCSSESFTENNVVTEVTEKNVDKEPDSVGLALPKQSKLTTKSFSALIASADAANLWIVTDKSGFYKIVNEMTEYYNEYEVSTGDMAEFSCCVYFDEESHSYFRALSIKTEGVAEVFLVDTGEFRPMSGPLRPLASRFCNIPPLAHCCHLAEVHLGNGWDLEEKQATFLSNHLWETYRIELQNDTQDNDSSESQGVYVYLDDGTTLNELMARELASSIPQPEALPISNNHAENKELQLDNQQSDGSKQDLDLDLHEQLKDALDYGPEHENPLEAVTGYCNRDEMDICKHYDGRPDRTCFKGDRCKKRHVVQHPDGWTLDRVPVVASCRPAKLPVPGTSCKVKVTHVRDVGCFFVQFESKDETMTLAELVEDMTRGAANAKPLKILPALGELVSARFTDDRWYRARVTSCDDELGTVEVLYIDYGNESSVKLTDVLTLESRWLALPVAAVRCRLAGVTIMTDKSVTDAFTEMVLDLALQARVIARSYDEVTLELFDLESFKISDQLAAMADVPLQPYEVEDDSNRTSLHIPG